MSADGYPHIVHIDRSRIYDPFLASMNQSTQVVKFCPTNLSSQSPFSAREIWDASRRRLYQFFIRLCEAKTVSEGVDWLGIAQVEKNGGKYL